LSPRYVHAGQPGTPTQYGKSLCGKLMGRHTPLSKQPEQVNCPTCQRRLQAGWLRWEEVPRGADTQAQGLGW